MAFFNRLKLSIKLPLMLVAISMIALSIMGISSYREARQLLEEEGNQRLERTLESRTKSLEQWSSQLQSELRTLAADQATVRLMRDWQGAWKRIGDGAAEYLRQEFITENPNPPQERYKLENTRDLNDFGLAHRRNHASLMTYAKEKGLNDIYFIHPDGTVLYSIRKDDAFTANLTAPEWANTAMARVFNSAVKQAESKPVASNFVQAFGNTSERVVYMAISVRSSADITLGVVAFEVPLSRLQAVMGEPRSLGETGQAYMVDAAGVLENSLRAPLQIAPGSSLTSPAIPPALAGEKGRMGYVGLGGEPVKGVYGPLSLFGRTFAVIVEEPDFELFLPATTLAKHQLLNATWLIAVLALISTLMARSVSRPLRLLNGAIGQIAQGNHATDVLGLDRRDEVGEIANALEALRGDLARSAALQREAIIQGTAFRKSSAALMIVAADQRITYVNSAFIALLDIQLESFRCQCADITPESLIGRSLEEIYPMGPEERARLQDAAQMPFHNDIALGEGRFGVDVNEICQQDGLRIGYVIEWRDVTELRMNRALLQALDNTQLMLEFSPTGHVTRGNANILQSLEMDAADLLGQSHADVLEGEGDLRGFWARLENMTPVIGRFVLQGRNGQVVAEGSVTPVPDSANQMLKIVFIANDITEAKAALDVAQARNAANLASQQKVVEALRIGLKKLSEGDLRNQIADDFPADYAQLRADFNSAVSTLSAAMQVVIDNAQTIDGEVQEISNAASDLSQRTEKQAATLAETATALDQITSSVSLATESISEADTVVAKTRENAEISGQVVQQAVQAMGEIEHSSQQISRIISVIDDIAFQTNLLALNAGVEAARAGEAGRGFAVVASEVRALAQRSSEAAREIDALISTSSAQVRRGVDLVGQAGFALEAILHSVNDIAARVSRIALSAREQSNGLAEINAAMIQLDQVTQQNAAMFEETSAASQALSRGVQALTSTTVQFQTAAAIVPTRALQAAQPAAAVIKGAKPAAALRVSSAGAALPAVALEESDWEDF